MMALPALIRPLCNPPVSMQFKSALHRRIQMKHHAVHGRLDGRFSSWPYRRQRNIITSRTENNHTLSWRQLIGGKLKQKRPFRIDGQSMITQIHHLIACIDKLHPIREFAGFVRQSTAIMRHDLVDSNRMHLGIDLH